MNISELELQDLDDFYKLSDGIENTALTLESAKQQLTELLATITSTVTKNELYWVGGKPPSVSYIKEQYQVIGYDQQTYDQLHKLRVDIMAMEALKAKYEREFNLGLKLLDVWRTYSANKRRMSVGMESE